MDKLVHYRVNYFNRICGVRRMDRVYLHQPGCEARGREAAKQIYGSAADQLRDSPYLKVDSSGGTVFSENQRVERIVGE